MSNPIEQVEGGSPKVAENWRELWLQRPTPVADAENYVVWGEAANEVVPHPCDTHESERYIPVSVLLSDEAIEAAARCRFEQGQFKESETWEDVLPHLRESMEDEAREVFSAAIDQLGGTDAR
jgi:hypothetical protein